MLLRNFNQQRRAQLTGPRHEGIVDVQLVLHFLRVQDMLNPDHFLGLKPEGLTIFKNKRDERSDGNPSPLLERDNVGTKLFPLPLILRRRKEVLSGQQVHDRNP